MLLDFRCSICSRALRLDDKIGERNLSNNLDAASTLAELTSLANNIRETYDLNRVFAAVAETADTLIGHRLFTVMAFDGPSMRVQRIYSSNATAYPPGVSKDKRDTQWGVQVLDKGHSYIGRNSNDIRENFADHEIILGLGLESILNVPVRLHGNTLGTMNLLNSADFYDTPDCVRGNILAALLVGPLLAVCRT